MEKVSINKNMKLSEHFTLGEVTKTSYHTADGNIPSHVAIENLRNICEGWLEDLRYSYNKLYGEEMRSKEMSSKENTPVAEEIPVVITSGYRSPEVNRLCGGAKNSNHLTGCAVDIRCMGPEQLIRYAGILLDIADGTNRDFDELILEKRGTTYWIHFAVRPEKGNTIGKGHSSDDEKTRNRRKILFDMR